MFAILLMLITAISALILLVFLVYSGIPWGNADIFLFSIVSLILVASLVGFLIAIFRFYCWKTTPGTNPTPTTLFTDPPDIGSVEAEFQNEFIGVFPMYQLKPRIDLDLN